MPAQTPQFADQTAHRRKLIILAGLLAMVLLANGVVGLFALHYANYSHEQSLKTVQRSAAALEAARSAQVSFKKQVQEWKNILLRGFNPEDYARYVAAFEKEEKELDARLEQAKSLAGQIGMKSSMIDEAIKGHHELDGKYREALGQSTSLDPSAAAAIDRKVRGIDRKPTDDMDAIVAQIQEYSARLTADAAQETNARYQALRRVSIAGTSIGLIVVFIFLAMSFFAGSKS